MLIIAWLLAILVGYRLVSRYLKRRKSRYPGRRKRPFRCIIAPPKPQPGFPRKKPDWVGQAVLRLRENNRNLSHRKLAMEFNRLYFAATGISVGRTWVRQLLIQHAYAALHQQQEWKHRVPEPLPLNQVWGIDTTYIADAAQQQHVVVGIIDHGSRLNLALRLVKRFNVWTLLGCVFLAIGQFGKPCYLKMDNHPVHHAQWYKRILRWAGVSIHYTDLASPWQNGRIERLFGTLKKQLQNFTVRHQQQLTHSLAQFQFWYNAVRPHQHLAGATPSEVWHGVDPYRHMPQQALPFIAWDGKLRGMLLRH